jgi:uncharacterized membrane protein YeaQ/YmgE (transglycosylase-associated protein family)
MITQFDPQQLIVWAVAGVVTSLILSAVVRTNAKGGVFGSLLLGIVGALIGGFIAFFALTLPVSEMMIASIFFAILGAAIATFIQRLLFRENKQFRAPLP